MSDDEPSKPGDENKTPPYERHAGPNVLPPEQESSGMHPAIKVLLILLVGIPVVFALLVLLVLGACFISG